MATLEKIRSKSVLLFVVIIVALLAFILGDLINSGQAYFGTGTTVAEAGDATVEYTEYSNRLNAMSEQYRNAQQAPDNDVLAQQVINEIIIGQLLEKEYADLGIVVTNKELSQALTGETPHPAAMQFISSVSQQLQLPTVSGMEVYQAMMNPAKYGQPAEFGDQLRQYWASLEVQVEESMKNEKFNKLMLGLFTANNLDAKNLFNDVATTRHISYAIKPLASIADNDSLITDADRKTAWEEIKNDYRLTEPVRSVDYIYARVEPSQADRLAGQQAIEDALMALNASDNLDAVSSNSKFVVNRASATKEQITDKKLVEYIDTAVVNQTAIIKKIDDSYTLAKLMGISNGIDSLNVSMLGRIDQGSLDSLLTEVKGGAKFASLIDGEKVAGQDSLWTSLIGEGIDAGLKAALTNNTIGEPFIFTDSINGQAIQTLYCVNKRHAAVPVYDIAMIEYTVDPSQETLNNLSAGLSTYVSNNSSAADFAANATEAGFTVRNAQVTASSAQLAGLSDTRPVIKWVMNAKKGQVMPVYQDSKGSYYLVAAVKDVYDGEYLPWNAEAVASRVETVALRNKKGAMLTERYAGQANDIAGYAKLMEVEPQKGDAIFTAPMLGTIGFNESVLQGAIASAEKGKLVGPIVGNTGVIVFTVDGEDVQGREYTFEEYSNQFNRSLGLGNMQLLQSPNYMLQLLLGNEEVKNHSLNFVQQFGE